MQRSKVCRQSIERAEMKKVVTLSWSCHGNDFVAHHRSRKQSSLWRIMSVRVMSSAAGGVGWPVVARAGIGRFRRPESAVVMGGGIVVVPGVGVATRAASRAGGGLAGTGMATLDAQAMAIACFGPRLVSSSTDGSGNSLHHPAMSMARRVHSIVDGKVPTQQVGPHGSIFPGQRITRKVGVGLIFPVVHRHHASIATRGAVGLILRMRPAPTVTKPCITKSV